MSSITDKDLVCIECKGEGEVDCDCGCCNCEGMIHCDTCDGTGVSEEFVDIPKWQQAVEDINHRLGHASRPLKKGGLFIGQRHLGTQFPVLLIKDYLLPEAAERNIPSE